MKIWDLPTRIYHWLQAILFIGLAGSGFSGQGPHIYLGLALFTLILWRLVWGIVGSDTSRFSQFIASPKTALSYLRGKKKAKPGHNPLGSWMVMALIATLFVQCITGIALAGLFDSLPLSEVVLTDNVFAVMVTLHGAAARILVAFVVVHLLAIVVYKLRSKPLVWAMVTGIQNKLPVHVSLDNSQSLHFSSNLKAFLVLIASLLVTMTIVVFSL